MLASIINSIMLASIMDYNSLPFCCGVLKLFERGGGVAFLSSRPWGGVIFFSR